MKNILVLLFLTINFYTFAQNNEKIAFEKAREAVKLMDAGKIDESIRILEECQKLDAKSPIYPYEIAYAYIQKKEYKTAIKILKKTTKYKGVNSRVYQTLGNCYDYDKQTKKAIKAYNDGLKKFPNAGNLYLEKGNIFLGKKEYDKAIMNYKKGIKVDPMFSSNYYRLALLYLNSNDKLNGLIYGEIFMNLERTTKRTQEISKLLFQTYKNSIEIDGDNIEIDFCEIIIGDNDFNGNTLKLPLCAIFGKNFILGVIEQKEVNLNTISEMRISFIENFYKEDYKKYANVLFDYNKKMLDKGVFEAYNHYILQIGSPDEFRIWKNKNIEKYNDFVEWYTTENNYLKINKKSVYTK